MTPSEDIMQDYQGAPVAIIVVIFILLAIFTVSMTCLVMFIVNLIFK